MIQQSTRQPSPLSTGSLSTQTDRDLALRARQGQIMAFDELARRYQVRLLRFIQRRVRSLADSEDLLQEAFVRAFERLNQYDESRPFATWLFTLAHRLAISHHRRQAVRMRAIESLATPPRETAAGNPADGVADEESRRFFWDQAKQVLSDEQMCAVWLFYVEDMPAPQIAEVLGRSWVSVKTILFRARRKLGPVLAEASGAGALDRQSLPASQAARLVI